MAICYNNAQVNQSRDKGKGAMISLQTEKAKGAKPMAMSNWSNGTGA